MDSEIVRDLSPFLRQYKDGRVERLLGNQVVPAGVDPKTGVESKDVVVSQETSVSARLYLPKPDPAEPTRKLPLLIYFHGGGFVIETASSPTYHNYLNILVAHAQIAVVSVDYRRAPEHPIPAAYNESWAALKWVAAHSGNQGPEQWLNDRADTQQVFLAGDSAGANIAHRMGIRAGSEDLGLVLKGIVLVHPYFWGEEAVGGEPREAEKRGMAAGLWRIAYPETVGSDDPWINPEKDPELKMMGTGKVLVCVAEKDSLRHRGRHYHEVLRKSGWLGDVEVMETNGEDHVFHLLGDPTSENSMALLNRVSSFINQR